MAEINNYDDIISLPHHVSKNHPQMSIKRRAAQFSPFAALNGYEDALEEISRTTEQPIELDDSYRLTLDRKLSFLAERTCEEIRIRYYIPDPKKSGGRYADIRGNLTGLDPEKKIIFLDTGEKIPMHRVIQIECSSFPDD